MLQSGFPRDYSLPQISEYATLLPILRWLFELSLNSESQTNRHTSAGFATVEA